jgi:D-amino peptidase
MEGVAGAVTGEQLGPSGFEYQRFRQFMTDEVNAAIEAAFAAGATEILVSDSHDNGQNLLIDQLPENVRVIRSWPRPPGMMAGIDESFDGVIYIGYHASTTNTEGVHARTMSSARLTAVKLNGMPVPEAAFNAAIAGHFGVPVIMVSGDDAIIEETRQIVGDVEGLVELEVIMENYRPVELPGYLPNVDRVDSHTICFVAKDMAEASGFMTFILSYNADLAP